VHVGASFHASVIAYVIFVFLVLEEGQEQQGRTTHQGAGDTQRSGLSTTAEAVLQAPETPCGQHVALNAAVVTTKTLTVARSVLRCVVSKFVVRYDSWYQSRTHG